MLTLLFFLFFLQNSVIMGMSEEYYVLSGNGSASSSPSTSSSSYSSYGTFRRLQKSESAPTSAPGSPSSSSSLYSRNKDNSTPDSSPSLRKSNSAPASSSTYLKEKNVELCPVCYPNRRGFYSSEFYERQTLAFLEAFRNRQIFVDHFINEISYVNNTPDIDKKFMYTEQIRLARKRFIKIYRNYDVMKRAIDDGNPIAEGHDKNSCKLLCKARFCRFIENLDLYDSLYSLYGAKSNINNFITQLAPYENYSIPFWDMMNAEIEEIDDLIGYLNSMKKKNINPDATLLFLRNKLSKNRVNLFNSLHDDKKFIEALKEPLFLNDTIAQPYDSLVLQSE